ncbi:MAG: hypothetical protein PHI98_15810, partial [Eubacteriales bacterium]|nr:hypothetical protein [Eubacteriales bacterium]
ALLCYAHVCGFGVFSAAFSPLCCIIYDTNDAYNKRVPQNHFEALPLLSVPLIWRIKQKSIKSVSQGILKSGKP